MEILRTIARWPYRFASDHIEGRPRFVVWDFVFLLGIAIFYAVASWSNVSGATLVFLLFVSVAVIRTALNLWFAFLVASGAITLWQAIRIIIAGKASEAYQKLEDGVKKEFDAIPGYLRKIALVEWMIFAVALIFLIWEPTVNWKATLLLVAGGVWCALRWATQPKALFTLSKKTNAWLVGLFLAGLVIWLWAGDVHGQLLEFPAVWTIAFLAGGLLVMFWIVQTIGLGMAVGIAIAAIGFIGLPFDQRWEKAGQDLADFSQVSPTLYRVCKIDGAEKLYPVTIGERGILEPLTPGGRFRKGKVDFVPKKEFSPSTAQPDKELLHSGTLIYRVSEVPSVRGLDGFVYGCFVPLRPDGRSMPHTTQNFFYLPLQDGWVQEWSQINPPTSSASDRNPDVDSTGVEHLGREEGDSFYYFAHAFYPSHSPFTWNYPVPDGFRISSPLPGAKVVSDWDDWRGYPVEKIWHNAIDLYREPSAKVLCAAAGNVEHTRMEPYSYGSIMVGHGEVATGDTLWTGYSGLAEIYVKPGDKVATGQELGRVGGPPASPGSYRFGWPPLHFAVFLRSGKAGTNPGDEYMRPDNPHKWLGDEGGGA